MNNFQTLSNSKRTTRSL